MDPLTIALLIGLGTTAAQFAAGEIAKAPARKDNREELDRLRGMRDSGVWLTPTEQQLLASQQTQLSSTLAQGQRRAEQIQGAAALGGSGGDVANARRASAQEAGRAVTGLQQQQLAFTAQQEAARRKELSARQAKREAMTADTVNAAAEAVNTSAQAVGQYMGELPAGRSMGAAQRAAAAESFAPVQPATMAGSGLATEGARLGSWMGSPYARDLATLEAAGYPRRAAQQTLSASGFYTPPPAFPTGF